MKQSIKYTRAAIMALCLTIAFSTQPMLLPQKLSILEQIRAGLRNKPVKQGDKPTVAQPAINTNLMSITIEAVPQNNAAAAQSEPSVVITIEDPAACEKQLQKHLLPTPSAPALQDLEERPAYDFAPYAETTGTHPAYSPDFIALVTRSAATDTASQTALTVCEKPLLTQVIEKNTKQAALQLVPASQGPLLISLVKRGNLRLLEQFLLSPKVSCNAHDAYGNTALHYAVVMGAIKTVQALVDAGADTSIRNADGQTACDLAITRADFYGADIFAKIALYLQAHDKSAEPNLMAQPSYYSGYSYYSLENNYKSERDEQRLRYADLAEAEMYRKNKDWYLYIPRIEQSINFTKFADLITSSEDLNYAVAYLKEAHNRIDNELGHQTGYGMPRELSELVNSYVGVNLGEIAEYLRRKRYLTRLVQYLNPDDILDLYLNEKKYLSQFVA